MVRCPVCGSPRVVLVLASPHRRAFCVKCSSRWIHEGEISRSVIQGPTPTPFSVRLPPRRKT